MYISGVWKDKSELSKMSKIDKQFEPTKSAEARENLLDEFKIWEKAVDRSCAWL